MLRSSLICVILLVCTFPLFAQHSVVLTGNLYDSSRNKIDNGTVVLTRRTDSIALRSAMVLHGAFRLDSIDHGEYMLRVSSVGFRPQIVAVLLEHDTSLVVNMTPEAAELTAVQVSGTKAIMVNNHGDLKLQVENSMYESVPSAIDLLGKLPGIQVAPDRESINSVEARGQPILYLDNQKVNLTDLNSLDVKDIKDIEIINNPSSKYEASGRMVIRITRKNRKSEGHKVTFTQSSSIHRLYNNYDGLNFNMKKNRLELKADLQYNFVQPWEGYSADFNVMDLKSQYSVISTTKNGRQLLYGGGVYYQVNKDDYFSINANGSYRDEPYGISTDTYVEDQGNSSYIRTLTGNQKKRNFLNAIANYNKGLPSIKSNLFMGVQYSRFRSRLNSVISNDFDSAGVALTENRVQNSLIQVLTGRADFEMNLPGSTKWETGINYSHGWSGAYMLIDSADGSQVASDYNYSEHNYAAYTQLSGSQGKINYTAGIRAERMEVVGQFAGSAKPLVRRNPTYLFPKVSITFPLDSTKGLTLAYNRSINLPNFSNLSQITVYINPYVVFTHNVNLLPAVTNELSAKLTWKDYSLRVLFYDQSDPIYFGTSYDPSQKVLTTVEENFKRERGVTSFLTIPFTIRRWTSTNTAIGNYSVISDPSAVLKKSTPSLYFYSANQFRLGKGYTLLASGWFLTKRYTGLYSARPVSAFDIGVSKNFNKFFVSVMANDIFRGLTGGRDMTVDGVTFNQKFFDDTKELLISVKYTFGEIKKSAYKTRTVDEHSDRVR